MKGKNIFIAGAFFCVVTTLTACSGGKNSTPGIPAITGSGITEAKAGETVTLGVLDNHVMSAKIKFTATAKDGGDAGSLMVALDTNKCVTVKKFGAGDLTLTYVCEEPVSLPVMYTLPLKAKGIHVIDANTLDAESCTEDGHCTSGANKTWSFSIRVKEESNANTPI